MAGAQAMTYLKAESHHPMLLAQQNITTSQKQKRRCNRIKGDNEFLTAKQQT
jgi:hypothetical protein